MNDKIRICVASYWNDEKRINGLYCFLYSMLNQTYQNFEIIFAHDGEIRDKTLKQKIEAISDKVKVLDNLPRKEQWGYPHRYFTAMIKPHADWVLFTNDDNYYVPNFLEIMLNTAIKSNSDFIYCDTLTKNDPNRHYVVMNTFPEPGRIDMGSFITKMELIKNNEWSDYTGSADGFYAKRLSTQTN